MEESVRRRVTLLLAAVLVSAGAIGARLVYVQIHCCDRLRARANLQHWREIEVPAVRGTVFDREGRELALSLKTESLFAHPRRVPDPERAATLLAPVIGLPQQEILERLRSDKNFVYIHRFLDPAQAAAVRGLGLPVGNSEPFGFLPSSKRYYPRGRLAVHVLGFANIDGQGVEGIEKQFDDELRGEPAHYLILQDGLKGEVRQKTVHAASRQPHDVVLTLDAVLQHVLERELEAVMDSSQARSVSGVLLDPATGELLALANRPAADPNHYGRSTADSKINRAVVHQYEPGSTFKIVSMAAALEHRKVRPEQWIDCEQGSYTYRGRSIVDVGRHRSLSARQVLEHSSNVGMVKIVTRLEPRELHDTIVRFGFGNRTGVELPGERRGNVRSVEAWSGQTLPSLAFGYEIEATVLQMSSALALIANEGVRAPLHVVLGLRDAQGRLQRFERPPATRVLDRLTALELTSMMEGVVMRGTGAAAQVSGYRIAGKTGTTHKLVDGRYSSTHYVASFGGFAPASAPRIVGLIVVDTPQGAHYGGQVAAPVFKRVMEDALRHLRAPWDAGELVLAADRNTRSPAARGEGRPR